MEKVSVISPPYQFILSVCLCLWFCVSMFVVLLCMKVVHGTVCISLCICLMMVLLALFVCCPA